MSLSDVKAFRSMLANNDELQSTVRDLVAARRGPDVTALAAKHGLECTGAELDQALQGDDLSPFELEMVGGGDICSDSAAPKQDQG